MVLNVEDLHPVKAGVVYSPGGSGWVFYPEDQLHVGLTGTEAARTNVRSLFSFDLSRLDPDAVLIRATFRLHLVGNEPPDVRKQICLRESPPGVTWTVEAELDQPVLALRHLANEIGLDLDFDLTSLVDSWRQGEENRGILLGFATSVLGLVTFGNGRPGEPAPVLRLIHALPMSPETTFSLQVEPDASRESEKLPCKELLVKNLGPGLAWVTPLYYFDRKDPLDPSGIPLGVLSAGEYLLIEPKLPAKGLSVRIETALDGTTVTLIFIAST